MATNCMLEAGRRRAIPGENKGQRAGGEELGEAAGDSGVPKLGKRLRRLLELVGHLRSLGVPKAKE